MKLKEAYEKVRPSDSSVDEVVKIVRSDGVQVFGTHREHRSKYGYNYMKLPDAELPEWLYDAEVTSIGLWAIDGDMICAEFEI